MIRFKYIRSIQLYYLLPVLIAIVNLLIFNRFYQPTEGWWQTFGYLINNRQEPYVDFNSAIVPFFMYLNSFFLKIFGENLIYFRLFGIFVILINIFLIQYLFSKMFNKTSAALGVFFAFALNMSTPVYLAYDYSTFIDFFVIVSLILYYFMIQKNYIFKDIFLSFLLGVTICIILFMKQNIGIFYSIFLIFSACIFKQQNRFFSILTIIIGFSFLFFVFSIFMQMSVIAKQIFLNNDAKGSAFTVLFRFIVDSYNLKVLILSFLCCVAIVLLNKLLDRKLFREKNKLTLLLIYSFYIGSFLVFFRIGGFYDNFISLCMIFSIAIILFLIFIFIKKKLILRKSSIVSIVIPLTGLAYCSTHTAGFNFIGMYIVVAFAMSYLAFQLSGFKYSKNMFFVLIFIFLNIALSKVIVPYNWWGMSQDNIFAARYKVNYPQMKNIFVDEKTSILFNTVKESIDKYSKEVDDVFLYPHIPIFYFLHHKKPPVKSIIQWFDFATTKQLADDLSKLKIKKPNLIVMFSPPLFVYEGHANLLKHPLIQLDYDHFFHDLILSGQYRIEKIVYFKDTDRLSQFKYIEKEFVVSNPLLNKKSIKDIVNTINLNNSDYYIVDSKIKNTNPNINIYEAFSSQDSFEFGNRVVMIGDTLKIRTLESKLNHISNTIGVPIFEKDSYILKILVKND